MPPTSPPALPPAPPPEAPGITTGGDPILKRSDGTEIQFFLEPAKFQRVFEQSPFNVSYLVGNPLDKHGGDWVLQVKVDVAVAGAKAHTLLVKIVDPATLLPADPARAMPTPGAPLTTMNVTVDGKAITAGLQTFGAFEIEADAVHPKRTLGNGFIERVDVAAAGFHLAIFSAKARKFSDPNKQVKCLHLDVELLEVDRAAIRGPLAEMLGFAPLSDATRKMLAPPA